MTDGITPAPADEVAELAELLGDFGTHWQITPLGFDDTYLLVAVRRPLGCAGPQLVRKTAAEMREALEKAESDSGEFT